jgi:hypothetical protein
MVNNRLWNNVIIYILMIFQKYLEIVIKKMMKEINLLWKLLEIKINLEI